LRPAALEADSPPHRVQQIAPTPNSGLGPGKPVAATGTVRGVFVKICGITEPEDALLAAGLGADAVGMIFAASSRRISTAAARDIIRRLPPEILAVGVFRNERRERVVELANTIGLRAVQLHGDESPEDTRWVAARVPAVIRAFSVRDPALALGADYGPHRLLIDSPSPGSGQVFDWSAVERVAAGRPFILAGGLTPDNVADAIELVEPWGVDVATGVESSPGHKDPAKVRRFIQAARRAASRRSRWPVDGLEGGGSLFDDGGSLFLHHRPGRPGHAVGDRDDYGESDGSMWS
jgi:phosphoribosylanthranilate isomerase